MKRIITGGVLFGLLVAGVAIAMFAGTQIKRLRQDTQGAVQSVLTALKEFRAADQTTAIRDELRGIRLLLEQQQQALRGPVRGDPTQPQYVILPARERTELGAPDAPLVLVEFVDYQCPFCRQFHDQAFGRLKTEYIDTGRVRYVSRDLPLPFHAQAKPAAQAAHCAGAQKQFWPMRQRLFSNQNDLSLEGIRAHARALSLNMRQFDQCVGSEEYLATIQQDVDDARAVGITGTPTFVLGRVSPDGIRGLKIVGAEPYEVFKANIEKYLAGE